MKRMLVVAGLLLSTSVFANEVNPIDVGQEELIRTKSRAEVLAELEQAIASGEMPRGDNAFAPEEWKSTKTRAQVVAELTQAIAAGQLPVGDNAFVPEQWKSTKTRAQVVAETREAARLGLLRSYGDQEPKVASAKEEQQIRLAGLRAIEQSAS